jgi:CotS family spore coat protein
MQTEFYELLQRKWNFYIKSVKKRRKVFLLDTTKGPVFIKGYDSSIKADWVVSLSEQLVRKGFSNTLKYYYTSDGLAYLSANGKHYVAMKPIGGRDAQYSSITDISKTTACLADFHRHARGIEGGPILHTTSCPQIDKWEDRLHRFNNIIERMKRARSLGSLDQRILRFSPYILQEAHFALDLARRSPLISEYSRALKERHIAHRDLASHNFLIGSHTYLIDYDTSVYDTQLIDLIQMLNRVLDQQAWSLDVFSKMLEIYQGKMPISEAQTALIFLLLKYPDNFMREVIGLYEGNGFVSKKIDAYLTMIMRNWRERNQFFQGSRYFFYDVSEQETTEVV